MWPKRIGSRILRKVTRSVFALFHRDSITFTRISRRPDLMEIGTKYGGWVIPRKLLHSASVCYCAGCGEDISFDLGLIDNFGCQVYAFDPTPRAIRHVKSVAGANPKYHFSDVGLWDKDDVLKFFAPRDPTHVSHSVLNLQKTDEYFEARVRRLSDIMREHSHQTLDLLKLDIEGAEYKVVDSIIEDRLDIRILCVEYDECFNPMDADYKNRIRASVNKLINAGYSLVCAQGNGNYTFCREQLETSGYAGS